MKFDRQNRMTKPFALSLSTVATVVLILSGCSTQQPYQRPALEVPEHFKEAAKLAQESGLWQPARSGDAAATVPKEWWTLYGDATLNQLQADAQAGSQTLAQAVARVRSARASVASSRASMFPTIGTTGSGSRAKSSGGNYTDSSTGQTVARSGTIANSYSLGLTASWEVDLWGRVEGLVSASEASAQASEFDLAAARLSLEASVAQTYFSIRAAEASQRLLKQTLEAYEQSWQLTKNRYKSGVASSADVAQAESQYKSTQAQLIESQSTRAQYEHALAALLGKAPAVFSLPESAELPVPPVVPAMLASQLLEKRPDIVAAERRAAAANAQIGVARAAYFPALTLSANTGYRASELSNLLSAPNLFWSLGPALALSC